MGYFFVDSVNRGSCGSFTLFECIKYNIFGQPEWSSLPVNPPGALELQAVLCCIRVNSYFSVRPSWVGQVIEKKEVDIVYMEVYLVERFSCVRACHRHILNRQWVDCLLGERKKKRRSHFEEEARVTANINILVIVFFLLLSLLLSSLSLPSPSL